MSNMGTPDDGYCKPRMPEQRGPKKPPMTIAEAVTRYGDDWRLMMPHIHFIYREHMESMTFDAWEALDMKAMERGEKSRIKTADLL